jgi:hypothetical protein
MADSRSSLAILPIYDLFTPSATHGAKTSQVFFLTCRMNTYAAASEKGELLMGTKKVLTLPSRTKLLKYGGLNLMLAFLSRN